MRRGIPEIGLRTSMLANEICYRAAGCAVALVVGVTGMSGQTGNAQIPLNNDEWIANRETELVEPKIDLLG